MNQFLESIPSGWIQTTLGEVVDFRYGKSLPAKTRNEGNVYVYGSNGIIGQHSNSLTKGPSLIIGRKGSIGEVNISDEPCWPIDTTYFVEKLYGQPHKFWYFFLQSLGLSELNRATALPGLNRNDAYKISIKIPPLNEQKRIVAKIEELQARSRRARGALETIPDLLEQLRQSILAAAFRGDLTKEWRKRHPNVEPASELLKRIRAERRKRWEEAELEKLKTKGLSEDKLQEAFANRRKQYKEPSPINTNDLPELPEKWCWASIEELSQWVTDGTHQPPPFTDKGIPFLVISNMVSGYIAWDTLQKWVSTETYDKYTGSYKKPALGDIIYSTVGSYGVAVEIMTNMKFMFQRHIAHIRPISKHLSVSYLSFALNSPSCKKQADKAARGVAQKTVNLFDLRRFAIPLSPLSEQYKLNELLSNSLKILNNHMEQSNSLESMLQIFEQAILSKAFRGELVPQDPNDEPASILLERIRQEKTRAVAEPKVKDKRKDKKMQHKQKEQQDILAVLSESGKALTPEEVFSAAGFDEASVDIFYEQRERLFHQNRSVKSKKAMPSGWRP